MLVGCAASQNGMPETLAPVHHIHELRPTLDDVCLADGRQDDNGEPVVEEVMDKLLLNV